MVNNRYNEEIISKDERGDGLMPYKDKQRQKEYDKKMKWYKSQIRESQLGTTSFKSFICRKINGKPDWKKEQQEIQNEKQKVLYSGYKQFGNRRKYLRHKFLSNKLTFI